jgi:hypothetical protein
MEPRNKVALRPPDHCRSPSSISTHCLASERLDVIEPMHITDHREGMHKQRMRCLCSSSFRRAGLPCLGMSSSGASRSSAAVALMLPHQRFSCCLAPSPSTRQSAFAPRPRLGIAPARQRVASSCHGHKRRRSSASRRKTGAAGGDPHPHAEVLGQRQSAERKHDATACTKAATWCALICRRCSNDNRPAMNRAAVTSGTAGSCPLPGPFRKTFARSEPYWF